MSKEKFTPGPWTTDPDFPLNIYCADVTGSIVATCDGFEYAPRRAYEKAANANLIAAAPDLYETLSLIQGSTRFDKDDAVTREVTRRMVAALARARGEQP